MLGFINCICVLPSQLKIIIYLFYSSAPMSKLVGFLPDNVPRILINRDIVQVMKSSTQNYKKQDEFCLFDACLLGNCDAVTQAIKAKMSNRDAKSEYEHYHSGRLVTDIITMARALKRPLLCHFVAVIFLSFFVAARS